MYGYVQPDPEGATLLEVSGSAQVVSQSDSATPRDQNQSLSLTIKNLTSDPVSITNGSLMLCEAGGWVDVSIPLFSPAPGSFLPAAPVTLAANAQATYSGGWGWGMGLSNFIVDLRAEGGGKQQHHHAVVPIGNGSSPAPAAISAPTPVYLGLIRNPAEVFPLWLDQETLWISVLGQVVNTTQYTVRLAAWHLTLEFDGKTVVDKDLALSLWTFEPDLTSIPNPVNADAAFLPDKITFFAFGFPLKTVSKSFKKGKLTLSANYKTTSQCGACSYESPIVLVNPMHVSPPVKALDAHHFWSFNNAPDHDGPDGHEWPAERYAYDILCVDDNGNSFKKSDPADLNKNNNFWAWGMPVLAVKGGTVISSDDTNPENDGHKGNPNTSLNYILIQHDDGTYAIYYHLRQNQIVAPVPHKLAPGGTGTPVKVVVGQQIAEIGNAGGSSEPHLHFACFRLDDRGEATNVPVIMDGLKTKAGVEVKAVPPHGTYKL
jgi:Peptidase family M23